MGMKAIMNFSYVLFMCPHWNDFFSEKAKEKDKTPEPPPETQLAGSSNNEWIDV